MLLIALLPLIGLIFSMKWGLSSKDKSKMALGRALTILHMLAMLIIVIWLVAAFFFVVNTHSGPV